MAKDAAHRQTRDGGCCPPDVCGLYCYNEELVRELQGGLPGDDALEKAERYFSALGNRTRLMILHCLALAEELCVCDMANALGMNLSTISHQLRHLRGLGLVRFRSEGKMAFYRLVDSRTRGLLCSEFAAQDVGS